MAGDWMKVEKDTPDKPEILAIAGALEITPDEAFGKCFRFWRWADSQLTDGNAARVTQNAIDALVGRRGFADALLDVGWLQARNGSLSIPNFDRHMSQTAKSRALTASRVSQHKKRKGNARVTLEPLPREEKRREEIKEPPYPLAGFSQAFQMAWDSWPPARRVKRETAQGAWRDAVARLAFKFDGVHHRAEDWLLERVSAYCKSPRAAGEFCSGIANWLTEGRYDDPPEAWADGGDAALPAQPPTVAPPVKARIQPADFTK
jgi:hypothetical protein